MKIKLLILFISTIFFTSCWFLFPEDKRTHDTCSEYGCGDNGKCVTSKNGDKNCKCYEDFATYSSYPSSDAYGYNPLEYCVPVPKKIYAYTSYTPIILLSSDGKRPPRYMNSDNLILFHDLYKLCDIDSYISEDRTLFRADIVSLYDYKVEDYTLESYKRIIFDKEIKDCYRFIDKEFYFYSAFLFDDGSIKYYPRGYNYKGINFKLDNDKIIKTEGSFYITEAGKLFYYDFNSNVFYIKSDELTYDSLDGVIESELIETSNLPINLNVAYDFDGIDKCSDEFKTFDNLEERALCQRKFQKAYVLFDNNTVKSYYKNENNEYIEEEPFKGILNNDEKILYLRDACIFTNQRNFYCNDNNNEIRTLYLDDGIVIENEDFFSFTGRQRLCYLDKNNKELYDCYTTHLVNEK
jgi:hypothetical protein